MTSLRWGLAILVLILFCGYLLRPPQQQYATETEYRLMKEHLDSIREWLWAHPPNGNNRAVRRQRVQAIQTATNHLPASTYLKYLQAWTSSVSKADTLEHDYLALAYLRSATQLAVQNIRATQVREGMAIWYLYNMGYVFKTPETCFGIDLHFRDAEALAADLDFLLVTHGHRDHFTPALLDAMLAAEKPVVTQWYPGSLLVTQPAELMFGPIRVKVDIGDHHRHLPVVSWNNMLMFQIDYGNADTTYTIYHSGDGNRFKKMQPDKPVDLFIVHVQLPMDVVDAIHYLTPRQTMVSHILELSHSAGFPLPLRWSFDFAFKKLEHIDENRTLILTWGERWLVPHTTIETNGELFREE